MQKHHTDKEINDPNPSSLDAEVFVPINLDWRKKYYRRVLKKRVIAFLLDIFLTLIPLLLLLQAIILTIISWIFVDRIIDDDLLFLTISLLFPLVISLMESSKWKGTFGKIIMKIEITDHYGNPISIWRSLWRNIMKALTYYIYCTIIGLIIQIIRYKKTKKLFHDNFSNTIIGERL
jgi:uncharacterized RDD family membrane protein YckC